VAGAEKAMVRILSKIDKRKYDITTAALMTGSGYLMPELEKTGVRVETLGARGKYSFGSVAFRLYKLIRDLKIQVLICSLYHPTILGRIVGKLADIPIILNWEHSERFGGVLRVLLKKFTIPFSDMIICDSGKVGIELKKCLNPPDSKIKVIPIGGINLDDYHYVMRNTNKDIKVGSVGRLYRIKGYHYLLEAAKIILEKVDNVHFYITGFGPEHNNLQQLITELKISNNFNLMGFQSDIPKILSEWDIYVQPSIYEGMCITVVEAIASGLPVVASNVGGIPESVIDGYNGFLIQPSDPKVLAIKILDLINDPHLRISMGERGRKIASKKYPLDKMVVSIEKEIDYLIKIKIGLSWNKREFIWESI